MRRMLLQRIQSRMDLLFLRPLAGLVAGLPRSGRATPHEDDASDVNDDVDDPNVLRIDR